jgi:Ca2+-binding EF-hand superfamily protein
MKAVPFVLAMALAGGVASAQPVDPYAPQPPQPREQLRAELLARFDRDHDGRLDPRERKHAIKTLRRMARQLPREQMRDARRAARLRAVIRRYDADGDGNVGPGEMPPELARKLRRLDRNGDGWVDDADF